jgi:Ca-activated chloride channel family protein
MTFAWPHVLWFLLAPAALLARELAGRYRGSSATHPNILRAEAGSRSLELKPPGQGGGPGRKSRIWLGLGLALGIAALARPQWGVVDEPKLSQSRDVLIAIDLSRSMLTGDVKPSRLERAKLLAQSLLTNLSGERVGLIAFAGTAFLQSPLSSDYGILDEFLPELNPDFMPVGGTNYGALMDTAAAAFGNDPTGDRYLIVLSDGGATDDGWRDHIDALRKKGIHVIGLGVGTAAGGFIPDRSGGFMKDERGAVVLSRLEGDNLRELAQKTGGVYRDAGEWLDLAGVLKASVDAGRRGDFLERRAVTRVERYQWFLAPALLYLLISFLVEFPVRPTPRDVKLSPRGGDPRGTPAVAGLIAALVCLAPALNRPAAAEQAADSGQVGRVVGRLSAQNRSTALDWSELARETVAWGERLRSGGQPVSPGPVHDALAAVDAGSALDVRAADWPQLRTQLEDLLHPPKEKKQERKQDQPKQNQKDQPSKQDRKQQQQDLKESARQPNETQKVGGESDRKDETLARTHPELAPLLDKLQQLRGQDAPAELWKKMQDAQPRPPSGEPEKDW